MPDRLLSLKRRVAALEGASRQQSKGIFTLGSAALDEVLGGGLERGVLHEVYSGAAPDASAAGGFAAGLAVRAARELPVVWVRHDYVDVEGGGLYGPGFVELGLDPGRLVLVRVRAPMDVLRAGAEAAACKSVGVVLMEVWGAPSVVDLTATRRLALLAATSGATVLMVRCGVAPVASAAATRWSVVTARSAPLEGNAPGQPTFAVTLQRHRNGIPERRWVLEWDRDQRVFNDTAALSGGLAAFPVSGWGSAEGGQDHWRAAG